MCAYFKSALSITVPATSRPKEGRLLALMCPFAKMGWPATAKNKSGPDRSGVTRSVEAAKAEQETTTRRGCLCLCYS